MKTIAITGKGGTGKSSISALIIRWISENISKSVLAVDADANVNLNVLLDVNIKETIGTIREDMKLRVNDLPGGMTKQQFFEYKIQSALVETSGFDLLAMGCPEGPGCYCYANNLLRDILKTIGDNYQFIVIDNEAGMEHLSRRTSQNIDYLLIISNPIVRGIQTAGNISRLVVDLETRVKEKFLILNRVNQSIPKVVEEQIKKENLNLLGCIPDDKELLTTDQEGKAIWPMMKSTIAYQAMANLLPSLNL